MKISAGAGFAALFLSSCVQAPYTDSPRILTEISPEFRGSWDENVDDRCADREPRFFLDAKSLSNFEAAYEVVEIKLKGPATVEVRTRLLSESGGPADATWSFKLVDDGRALANQDGKPPYYRRCPS